MLRRAPAEVHKMDVQSRCSSFPILFYFYEGNDKFINAESDICAIIILLNHKLRQIHM